VNDEIIQVEQLGKVYRQFGLPSSVKHALSDITLEHRRGEILAVLGLNGAGKSTLVKILLGMVRPTGGHARLFGKSVNEFGWRNRVGYLPEVFRVPSNQSGASVLRFLGAMSGLTGRQLSARIDECLGIVDLSNAASLKTRTYSKGMVVRLGIAQAILAEPELLFLDEPTEGLDPVGKVMIRNLLTGLASRGTTILLNSHLLSEVEYVADRVAILHKGRLIRAGRLTELIPMDSRFVVEFSGPVLLPPAWNLPLHESRTCEVQSMQQLQELLEYLKANKLEPFSIRPVQTILEESFLRYIKEE
jgi:ABC-2 type transport system ATP-binding protein